MDGWLRDHGLPTLVPVSRWSHDLPRRVAPLQVLLTALLAILSMVIWLGTDDAGQIDESATVSSIGELVAVGVALVLMVAVPALLAWLTHRALDRMPRRPGTAAAWAVIVVATLVAVPLGVMTDPDLGWWLQLATSMAGLLTAFALVWLGGTALLTWTLRVALRNIGAIRHMASVALPVILMLVVFAFFSSETWQLVDALSWPRLFGVGLVIAGMAMVAVLPTLGRAALDDRIEVEEPRRRSLLAGLGLAERHEPDVPARRLSRLQQFNVLLVLVVAQLLLGGMFAVVQAGALVLLGEVALTTQTQTTWVGHPPDPLQIGRVTTPVTVQLLKASAFLAMLSALTFSISAVSDAQYRVHFFEPILREVHEALLVDSARRADPAGR